MSVRRLAISALLALAMALAPAAAGAAVRTGPSGSAFYTPPKPLPGKSHGDAVWVRKDSGETRLAEASLDRVSRRNPQATAHKTTFAELQKLTPRLDWAGYFDAAQLIRAALNVQEPKFLQAVDRQLVDW